MDERNESGRIRRFVFLQTIISGTHTPESLIFTDFAGCISYLPYDFNCPGKYNKLWTYFSFKYTCPRQINVRKCLTSTTPTLFEHDRCTYRVENIKLIQKIHSHARYVCRANNNVPIKHFLNELADIPYTTIKIIRKFFLKIFGMLNM